MEVGYRNVRNSSEKSNTSMEKCEPGGGGVDSLDFILWSYRTFQY
jgi:hypothetical protein